MTAAPPYAGAVIDIVDRLRRVGIEPCGVSIPGRPTTPHMATLYGLPVFWTAVPGAVTVNIPVGYLIAHGNASEDAES